MRLVSATASPSETEAGAPRMLTVGGRLFTVILTGCAAESGGAPLSVTNTLKVTLPPLPSSGVQANSPVAGSMAAPAGAPAREKASPLAGRSGSLAAAVKVTVAPSSTVRSGIGASAGGRLTSRTVIVKLWVTESGPS